MLNEFKAFIARGNVMDLAVGILIGGAFTLIVNSLVNDIIMPIIGAITGGLDFSNFFIPLSSAVTATSLAAARKRLPQEVDYPIKRDAQHRRYRIEPVAAELLLSAVDRARDHHRRSNDWTIIRAPPFIRGVRERLDQNERRVVLRRVTI